MWHAKINSFEISNTYLVTRKQLHDGENGISYNYTLHLLISIQYMAVRTTGAGGAQAPLTSKAGGLSPPKKDLSVPKLIHVFNGLQCYTCINPMIMVKLTSKGQKSMSERVKNRKKFLGGVSPDPLAALVSSSLEEPP